MHVLDKRHLQVQAGILDETELPRLPELSEFHAHLALVSASFDVNPQFTVKNR
jgi:hypothetical protein